MAVIISGQVETPNKAIKVVEEWIAELRQTNGAQMLAAHIEEFTYES